MNLGKSTVVYDEKKARIYFHDGRKFHCPSCDGTGLYQGLAEGAVSAVECRTCDGKGLVNFISAIPAGSRNPVPEHITTVIEPMRSDGVKRNRISIADWLSGKKP